MHTHTLWPRGWRGNGFAWINDSRPLGLHLGKRSRSGRAMPIRKPRAAGDRPRGLSLPG